MIALRTYQNDAVGSIRAAFAARIRRVLFVLPTGGGKTVVFAWIGAAVAAKGKRVLILVHRAELVEQVRSALEAMGVPFGIIAAGHPETDHAVQIASVQTLARRLGRVAPFDLVVTDEAHHAVAGTWRAVTDAMPDAFSLGVTATPARLDGRGLGAAFDVLIEGPSVADLTAAGHLAPARVFAPLDRLDLSGVKVRAGDYEARALAARMTTDAVLDGALAAYLRHAADRPAVAFCAGIDHSQAVAARFLAAGIAAAHVDGTTPAAERKRLIAALGTGEIRVLCNAGLISEGVDVPAIGAAILLRPTKSVSLYLQQVGRALRPSPGKRHALVLDHAGNTFAHGLPDAARTWSLDGYAAPGRREAPGARLRQCGACGCIHSAGTMACAACANPLAPTAIEQREIDAEASAERRKLARRVALMRPAELQAWASTPDRLRVAAEVRGYRGAWVAERLEAMGADHGGGA